MGRPTVYVCRGKDYRRRKKAQRKLLAVVEARTRVELVGCQKICAGPVCGFEVDGTLEWFGSLRSDKSRAALSTALEEGWLRSALRNRRVRNRRGKLRD